MSSRLIVFLSVMFSLLLTGYGQRAPAQPWGGAALSDWQNADKPVVISDLSKSTPASALSQMKLAKNRWKVIPYELRDGLRGKMVWAPAQTNAPELRLSLGQKGYYAIFVGLFSTSEVPTVAWLRLSGDPAPVRRANSRNDEYGNTEEVFFKAAQLDANSSLCISQRSGAAGTAAACGVTHIKLVPLSALEIERIEADRLDKSRRVLTATSDGFSDMFGRSPRTKAELLSALEHLRNTDFGTLILHSPGADKVNYPSKVGYMKGSHAEEYPRPGDRNFFESAKALAQQGINPVRTLIDGAHALGMNVHVGIRPAGWSFFEPYTDYWESPFFRDNPQWRCQDRDGTPVERMSWAVPEVRRHCIEVLRELVSFGADGAHLVFNRGYPLVLYEPPARRLFEEAYGVDPRNIDENDARILKWRAGIVQTFFQELRAMLDAEAQRRGKGSRLAISVMVLGTAQDDSRFGVDLGNLIGAGLVDAVYTERGFGRTANTYNLELLRGVCVPKGVPFSPGMTCSPRWYLDIPSYYEGGAAGLTLWDADQGTECVYHWTCVSRFGHREETLWRLKNLDIEKPPRTILFFKTLGNHIRGGRFGPWWGG